MGKDRAGNPLNPRFNNCLNAIARSKGKDRQNLNLVLRIELESEPLPDRREQQHDLHHREIVSDTLPWPGAEREVSILRGRITVGPSFGLECTRLVEVAGIAVSYPLKRKKLRIFRHAIAANLRLFKRLPAN